MSASLNISIPYISYVILRQFEQSCFMSQKSGTSRPTSEGIDTDALARPNLQKFPCLLHAYKHVLQMHEREYRQAAEFVV
jgi:hypothetical protein